MFFILFIVCELALISAENASATVDTSTEVQDNMNVILFLAHTDVGVNYESDDAVAGLNLTKIGKIKPCTMRPETRLPRAFSNIIERSQRKECDCKKLLESSIFSLMGWARNAMGMTTAVVSLINNEMVAENEKRLSHLDVADSTSTKERQQYPQDRSLYTDMYDKNDFGLLPFPKFENIKGDDLPKLERDADFMERTIPIINAYSHEPKLKFNNIHKYNRFGDFVNVRRTKRKLIVEPKHTQVFEINTPNEKAKDMMSAPTLERSDRPESIWDLMGLMSAVRRSFFVNFLNPMLDPQQRLLDEENGLDVSSLGQMRMPSLFQLVQTTLNNLQSEMNANHAGGFLLIVFGGSLSDVSQVQSDLGQSIKHVQETTNAQNTLIIVTGSCPENHTHNHTDQNVKSGQEFLLPVYAKGPKSELLAKAKELFDIPVQIKAALKESKANENDNPGREKNNLDMLNQNSKLFEGNGMDPIENMFNNDWKQSTKSSDEGEGSHKWGNMRKKRSALEYIIMMSGSDITLISNAPVFTVLFIFIFFL